MEFVLLYLLVNIAVGAIACFFGKKLFYLMLGALVFLGVFNMGLSVTDGSPVALVLAIALSVTAALLSKFAYKVGVFLMGCVAGAALGFVISILLPAEMADYSMIVIVVLAIVCALGALHWCDLFVRWGTAYSGATFMSSNLLAAIFAFTPLSALAVSDDMLATFDTLSAYIAGPFSAAYATPIFVATLVLTVVGAVVQKHGGE